MNRSQQIRHQVVRFINSNYEVSEGSKINLLEVYELYLDFINNNAVGYAEGIGDFQKDVLHFFPMAKLNDDKSISGLQRRIYEDSGPIVRDVLGDTISRRLNYLTRGERSSFRAIDLCEDNQSSRAHDATLAVAEIEAWLQKAIRFYFNPHNNRWIRGD